MWGRWHRRRRRWWRWGRRRRGRWRRRRRRRRRPRRGGRWGGGRGSRQVRPRCPRRRHLLQAPPVARGCGERRAQPTHLQHLRHKAPRLLKAEAAGIFESAAAHRAQRLRLRDGAAEPHDACHSRVPRLEARARRDLPAALGGRAALACLPLLAAHAHCNPLALHRREVVAALRVDRLDAVQDEGRKRLLERERPQRHLVAGAAQGAPLAARGRQRGQHRMRGRLRDGPRAASRRA